MTSETPRDDDAALSPAPAAVQLFPDTDDPLVVRPANSFAELEAAYELVYRSYLGRGYIQPNDSHLRVSIFNFLKDAITFVGVYGDSVIATVSLIPDTTAGLPMEEIYHDELEQIRTEGRKLAEVTMLADRRVEVRRTLPMLLALMKQVLDYSMHVLNATDICITINPRHNDFYERYLLFSELGGLRSYPSVRNNPALGKRLDLTSVKEQCQGHPLLLRLFFESDTSGDLFAERYRLTNEDITSLVERTTLMEEASPALVECGRAAYPDLPWDKWIAK
jgi:N-acyl amino acid synthase FeeM